MFKPPGRKKARCLVVLGHGAGGDVDAPDIVAARDAALKAGAAVALVTQPYRVAGKRSPAPAPALDEAWLAVMAQLPKHGKLIVGGRSSGARVACRTAAASGAVGVIALAFPLHPPGKPEKSRDDELRECGVPALVINGDADPFGVPEPGPGIELVVIPGARHDLRKDLATLAESVKTWVSKHT
ncbi:alpha/beta family hydrolase [Allorhizocola rhizosphaerae]|uniref:alpha/beta hydrolase family protein n=1 Tax=Allorhizocola rhizosphaerae TaxID=1872709 RepID=UPI000E3E51F7|nr:alpha/beta family hydrolase [Allorhizocola rhizosphaerae]